jgi:hypothetical protein
MMMKRKRIRLSRWFFGDNDTPSMLGYGQSSQSSGGDGLARIPEAIFSLIESASASSAWVAGDSGCESGGSRQFCRIKCG